MGIASAKIAAAQSFGIVSPGFPQVPESQPAPEFRVFQHGVASGDPLPDSVIIWTRVSSHPGDTAGSNQGRPVGVKWDVATDEGFGSIVASGSLRTDPASDNTVKVDVKGLSADSYYFYRFTVTDGDHAGEISPIGHTRTAPPVNSAPEHLGIALTSCANWESGYFSAYRDMATNDKIDVIMCVGDYIYEYERGGYSGKGPVRDHLPAHETVTLADYRLRYATYHTDPDLQEAHRKKPWIVTWDDHEVANDTYRDGAENHDPAKEGDFAARREAAIQAYLEWLPVRAVKFSEGGHLYRNFRYGDLADITMLDLRTYRDKAPEFKNLRAVDDDSRTMLGSEQFQFLRDQWASSSAKWRLVGNSVMFTPVLIPPMDPEATRAVTELLGMPQDGLPYNADQWDGYAAERRRLMKIMEDEGYDNVVFLTGDIHSSWACNVPRVPGRYPNDGIAAMEIVCSSVSASNIDDIVLMPQDNPISLTATAAIQGANRYVQYLEFDRHGYAAVYVGRDDITAEYRLVEVKEIPDQELYTRAVYRGERGKGMSRVQ
nr:alkaline phosphatase D family protein [Corynebacterium lactis]